MPFTRVYMIIYYSRRLRSLNSSSISSKIIFKLDSLYPSGNLLMTVWAYLRIVINEFYLWTFDVNLLEHERKCCLHLLEFRVAFGS
jgi:hypothetical protein